jgi:fermentation-respiration switch protein FrsA (DUF1100 family)
MEKYRVMVPDPETKAYYATVVEKEPHLAHADLTLESVELLMDFKPEKVVGMIAPRPLLLMGAELDVLVRPIEAETLYANAGEPKELVMVPGVGHFNIYGGATMDHVMGVAYDFYQRTV